MKRNGLVSNVSREYLELLLEEAGFEPSSAVPLLLDYYINNQRRLYFEIDKCDEKDSLNFADYRSLEGRTVDAPRTHIMADPAMALALVRGRDSLIDTEDEQDSIRVESFKILSAIRSRLVMVNYQADIYELNEGIDDNGSPKLKSIVLCNQGA